MNQKIVFAMILISCFGFLGTAVAQIENLQMGDSLEVVVKKAPTKIPAWIKNNASWWASNQIPDEDFANGIAYLINNGIIDVQYVVKNEEKTEEKIPSWIRKNAGWWSQGLVSDDEFLNGLTYMIKTGIIVVDTSMKISSDAFLNGTRIPSEYTCDGTNVSPKLMFSNIPNSAKSLALILSDPDAPSGTFTHWLVWNISPTKSLILKGENLSEPQGMTGFGTNSYGGPCPPTGIHRYVFELYALDDIIELSTNSKKQDLESAISTHVIQKAELVGTYSH